MSNCSPVSQVSSIVSAAQITLEAPPSPAVTLRTQLVYIDPQVISEDGIAKIQKLTDEFLIQATQTAQSLKNIAACCGLLYISASKKYSLSYPATALTLTHKPASIKFVYSEGESEHSLSENERTNACAFKILNDQENATISEELEAKRKQTAAVLPVTGMIHATAAAASVPNLRTLKSKSATCECACVIL